ncbi:MAG: hypothetical protein AAF721_39930 [Myxococcota bacterium]
MGARLLLALATVGCGGGGANSFMPQSVPGGKPLDELDPVEQESFCEEAAEWAVDIIDNSLPRLLCSTEAIAAGGTATGFDIAACQAAQNECLARPAEEDPLSASDLSCDFTELGPSCDATVDEFARCFEEAAGLTKRLVAALTCENVAAGNVPSEADYQLSAACQAILDDCDGGASDVEEPPDPQTGGMTDGGTTDGGSDGTTGDPAPG